MDRLELNVGYADFDKQRQPGVRMQEFFQVA